MRRMCAALLLLAGCGGGGGGEGELEVTREVRRIPGAQPEGTPDEYNASQVLIFSDGSTPDAVIVAVPGFLGGANAFRPLAEHLVRRGGIEVWAVDRRANLLEDLTGASAEEPEAIAAYYRDGGEVAGRTFDGFRRQEELEFMREWGLAVHADDLRAVLDAASAAHPEAKLFLAGHSLGASFAEAYAGHAFDGGGVGADGLEGLILIDGVLRSEALTAEEHAKELDDASAFVALPFLGVEVYATLHVAAARALADPAGVVEDAVRDAAIGLMLSVSEMPRMTNRAVLGFALDDEYNPLPMLWTKLGQGAGGAIGEYDNPLAEGTRKHPTDPDAIYDWVDGPEADPAEYVEIATLARSVADPRSDFAEWYFPGRLPVDLSAVAPGEVTLPVLSIPAGLFPDAMGAVADRMKPGTSFSEVDARHLAHVDVLVAADVRENPIPDAVAEFVR